jgi:hypothetical protein
MGEKERTDRRREIEGKSRKFEGKSREVSI